MRWPEPRSMAAGGAPAAMAASSALVWREARAGASSFTSRNALLRLLVDGVAVGDLVVICAASWFAHWVQRRTPELPLDTCTVALLAAVLNYKACRMAGAYNAPGDQKMVDWLARSAQTWSLVFGGLVCLAYVTGTVPDLPRSWAAAWYLFALAGLMVLRLGCHLQIRQWRHMGRLACTVAIVDLTGNGERLAKQLRARYRHDVRLVGVFVPEPDTTTSSGVDELITLARLFRIDEVLITASATSGAVADEIVRRLGILPTNLRICPDMPELAATPLGRDVILDLPALTVRRRPMAGWNAMGKRLEDLLIGSIALILLSPLMLVIAFLIKIDSRGPVLFRQKRLGFNNNAFMVLKFRTMVHQAPGSSDHDVQQARRQDPRVTRVGRFLRRTSLDEVPQLLNVLRGEMSLVGPRPHALSHNEQYAQIIDDYLGRHRVLPGLTGLAQVNGFRGETDTVAKMQQRVAYDLTYIETWSLLLDLRIILRTALVFLFQPAAY